MAMTKSMGTLPRDLDSQLRSIRPPPGLEMPCPPPGLEEPGFLKMMPPPGLGAVQPMPKKQPAVPLVAAPFANDPLWELYKEYKQHRSECLQYEKKISQAEGQYVWTLAGSLATNRVYATSFKEGEPVSDDWMLLAHGDPEANGLVRKASKKKTSPVKPPGCLEPRQIGSNVVSVTPSSSTPLKPPGVFKKSESTHSLASLMTMATLSGEVEDNQQRRPSISIVSALDAQSPAKAAKEEVTKMNAVANETVAVETVTNELWTEVLGADGHLKINWRADAKKLSSKDKQIVSPSFEISPGCSLKLIVKPEPVGSKRGQACFRKARGRGSVDVKLSDSIDAPTICFRISVGETSTYGPVVYDFGNSSVYSLPNDHQFNFTSAVDPTSSTFLVSFEVFPDSQQPQACSH